MGTDKRIFEELNFHHKSISKKTIEWESFENCNSLEEYAKKLIPQVDTSQPFILVGVSMGGMLAMEMSEIIHPERMILISSAKSHEELPLKYKMGRYIPLHRLTSDKLLAILSKSDMPFKDVWNTKDVALYQSMLHTCGADFLTWQMDVIANWQFTKTSNISVFHIHGTDDNILPYRKVKSDVSIETGTHKMIVNYRNELVFLIELYLSEQGLI